ncbi:MAG TPA: PEGA domain-containing protein [Anaeromyxobacteraceae bacterium]|nr:PEGA domain-containing protein [Anaeromyxobacteraceae bacterium]
MPARRLAFLAAVTAACASAPARPPPPPPPAAAPPAVAPPAVAPAPAAPAPAPATGLAFSVEPRDARISVDGAPRGTVAELGTGGVLTLPPGIYQVSLASPGHVTWRAEVAVRSAVERIEVKLVKKP